MLLRLADPYRLSLASLLVFLVGVPTIFLTRFVFHETRPEYFARSIPTISKSSAFAPASHVFLAGMLVVATCIVISWWLVYRLSRERARALSAGLPQQRLHDGLALTAATLGSLAGICLALLAIVTLETHDPLHIVLSYVFFITQLSAFVADTVGALLLNRALRRRNDDERYHLGGKPLVCLAAVLLGLLYLFLFLSRDNVLYLDGMTAQGLYVINEYVLATFCFAYAALYFPELRRHFGRTFDGSSDEPIGLASPPPKRRPSTPSSACRS